MRDDLSLMGGGLAGAATPQGRGVFCARARRPHVARACFRRAQLAVPALGCADVPGVVARESMILHVTDKPIATEHPFFRELTHAIV